MSPRRTLILVAAIVIGALASFLVYGYVSGVQDEAYDDAERRQGLRRQADDPQGDPRRGGSRRQADRRGRDPEEVLSAERHQASVDDIAGKVAVNDLAVNQVVTTDMFADPATVSSSFVRPPREDQRRGPGRHHHLGRPVRGVAGLLQPGDYVNIMSTEICQNGESAGSGGGGGGGEGGDGGEARSRDDPCAGLENILFGSRRATSTRRSRSWPSTRPRWRRPARCSSTAEDEAAATDADQQRPPHPDRADQGGAVPGLAPAGEHLPDAGVPGLRAEAAVGHRPHEPAPGRGPLGAHPLRTRRRRQASGDATTWTIYRGAERVPWTVSDQRSTPTRGPRRLRRHDRVVEAEPTRNRLAMQLGEQVAGYDHRRGVRGATSAPIRPWSCSARRAPVRPGLIGRRGACSASGPTSAPS